MLTTPDAIVFISLEVLIFLRLKVRANKEIKFKRLRYRGRRGRRRKGIFSLVIIPFEWFTHSFLPFLDFKFQCLTTNKAPETYSYCFITSTCLRRHGAWKWHLNDNAQSHLSPSLSPFWVVESHVIT